MTDEIPPPMSQESAPPPPPPSSPPPAPSPKSGNDNRTIMIVLAYLYFFCLVPLFVEKEDKEVQWHAKHGTVLLGADIALAVFFTVLSGVTFGIIGCILAPFWALLHFALFVVRIIAIVKGTQGERLIIPGLSPLADKF